MDTESGPESLLLPPRSRLLYIGLPKTGTTSMQTVAGDRRADLVSAGVRYPGKGVNHRLGVAALMQKKIGWDGNVPPEKHWQTIIDEIDGDHDNRIWISHEFACESDPETARRFVRELGGRVHIAITLRSYASTLGSVWQQNKKIGNAQSMDDWLRRVLGAPDSEPGAGAESHQVADSLGDQGGIVERWADAAGAGNVTVIIVDKNHPDRLSRTFEDMLGLEPGFLAARKASGFTANRSMSVPEAELLRLLNTKTKGKKIAWSDHVNLVQKGAVRALLENRSPTGDEERIKLPVWAAEKATNRGREIARRIEASGVHVVGDLATLYEPVETSDTQMSAMREIPIDIAVEALGGLLSAALGRGPAFGKVKKAGKENKANKAGAETNREAGSPAAADADAGPPAERAARQYTNRELVKALQLRLARPLRTKRGNNRIR
ncbi:hypothetical protein [Arthrobacter pigmenti]